MVGPVESRPINVKILALAGDLLNSVPIDTFGGWVLPYRIKVMLNMRKTMNRTAKVASVCLCLS